VRLSLATFVFGCKDGRHNLKTTYTTVTSSGRYASLALTAYIILVAVVSRLYVFYLFFYTFTLSSSSHRVRLILCPEDHHRCSFYFKSYSSSCKKVNTKGLGCGMSVRVSLLVYKSLPFFATLFVSIAERHEFNRL
jgi:hypothetical protein